MQRRKSKGGGALQLESTPFLVHVELLEPMYYKRLCTAGCADKCCTDYQIFSVELAQDIVRKQKEIEPYLRPSARKSKWFDGNKGFQISENLPDRPMNVVSKTLPNAYSPTGHSCIFADANGNCALHTFGLAEAKDGWKYKPLNCWIWPLVVRYGVIRIARAEYFDFPLNLYGRCLAKTNTPTLGYELFAPELSRLLGKAGYEELKAYAHKNARHKCL